MDSAMAMAPASPQEHQAGGPELDAFVHAAAVLCGAPVAVLCLSEGEGIAVQARCGRSGGLVCAASGSPGGFALAGDDGFEVSDARADPRFADHPLVCGDSGLRFHAGAAICSADGTPVGALCVLDHFPRRLDDGQRKALGQLARAAALALEGRGATDRLARVTAELAQAREDLAASNERFQSEISYSATHDELTGLINRSGLEMQLRQALAQAQATPIESSLLVVRLDQLRLVNGAFGHAAGDGMLRLFAGMLAESVGAVDTLARYSGEEFALLLQDCPADRGHALAQRICHRMDTHRVDLQSRRMRMGTSIGVVPVDRRWQSLDEILKAADATCGAAHELGGNRVYAWSDTDQLLIDRHSAMQWASRVEHALEEDRFVLYGQRIVGLADTPAPVHAEVLLRMIADDGTLVQPGAFLPAAERFNLATRIDRWVLTHAVNWMQSLSTLQGLGNLSVNLSGQSLGDRSFHIWATEWLMAAGARVCGRLCLEITETAAVAHMEDAIAFVQRVRAAGVRVALDDFGAGASSFTYLKKLPVDYLKIDGMYIRSLLTDPLNDVAVRCFVEAASVMGVKTVAEFVEQPAVLQRLREVGVDYAQGYLLHRPAPLAELVASVIERSEDSGGARPARAEMGPIASHAARLPDEEQAVPSWLRQRGAAPPDSMLISYESLPAMMISVDRDGRLLAASDRWLDKVGYTREEVIGQIAPNLLTAESRAYSVGTVLPRLFATGKVDDIEYQLVTKQGEILDVLFSAIVEYGTEGTPLRTLSVMKDITQRRRAERALRDEQQRLLQVIEATQAGTWECNLLADEFWVNDIFMAMLGHAPGDSPFRTSAAFADRVHPGDRFALTRSWVRMLRGSPGVHEIVYRVRHCDGHWVWILGRGEVGARDGLGRARSASGIHLDISERKAAAELAKTLQRDLRSVLDAMPAMIGYWDRSLVNRFANRAFSDWFGIDLESFPGTQLPQFLGESLYRQNLPYIEAALSGQAQSFERALPRPDGHGVRHSRARYLPDVRDGEVQGFYVLVEDVTDLKQAQTQLEAVNVQLLARTQQAESANVAKSEFLAAMSHELRTPLTSMRGYAELMQGSLEQALHREMAGSIARGAIHLTQLLTDILDLSKLEAGAMPLTYQEHDLRALLQSTVDFFGPTAMGKGLKLTVEVAEDVPQALACDSLKLQQILNNLLCNAIKFTEVGSVCIRAERNGESIAIHVDDTGPGIPQSLQETIFEKFRQANGRISNEHGGTGLGLALSRGLAVLMRGRLTVGSAIGAGSRFSLTLPVASADPVSTRLLVLT